MDGVKEKLPKHFSDLIEAEIIKEKTEV